MTIKGKALKDLRKGMCHTSECMAGILAMPHDYYQKAEDEGLVVTPGGFEAWRLRECLQLAINEGSYTLKQKEIAKAFMDLIPV